MLTTTRMHALKSGNRQEQPQDGPQEIDSTLCWNGAGTWKASAGEAGSLHG